MSRAYDHDPRIPAILQFISGGPGSDRQCRQSACRAKRWRICGRPGCFQGIPRIPPLQLQPVLSIRAIPRDEGGDP